MSRIRSITIGTRLALAFGALCVACLAVALVAVSGVSSLGEKTETVAGDARTQSLVGGIAEDVALNTAAALRHRYVLDGDLRAQDRVAHEIADGNADITKAIEELERLHPD